MASQSLHIKHDVQKFYDQNGPIYLEVTQAPLDIRLHYLKKLIARLPHANRTILELGCGAGVPCTQFLAQHGGTKIIANDISGTQIALARERLPQSSVELRQGDMMELRFLPGQFDAVSAIYTIFHLPRAEQTIMLRRIHRWLKLGGFLLISFSPQEVPGVAATSFLSGAESGLYWSGWGPEKIREILAEMSFQEIDESAVDMESARDGRVETPYHWVLARKIVGTYCLN